MTKPEGMKVYEVSWESARNLDSSGTVFIEASSLVEAQDRFFLWLREQDVYAHMWSLCVYISETNNAVFLSNDPTD